MMNVSATLARRAFTLSVISKPLLLRSLSTSSTDKVHLLVNAVGVDRHGIVAEMTKHVTDAGGNVGQSKASTMGSNLFSVMMLVQVPKKQQGSLEDLLGTVEGLNASVFETEPQDKLKVTPRNGYAGRFTLSGADNPGIVHKVTSLLANFHISIDTMETTEAPAPYGGTTLFLMEGLVSAREPLGKEFSPDKIRALLEELGDSLNCDITLEDLDGDGDASVLSSM